MDLEEAEALLRLVTYKPEWEFGIEEWFYLPNSGPFLRARGAPTADAEGGPELVRPGCSMALPPLERLTPNLLYGNVRSIIQKLEEHEIDEWLKVGGKHFREPHPELEHFKMVKYTVPQYMSMEEAAEPPSKSFKPDFSTFLERFQKLEKF